MIETWGFREDLKPEVLHQEDDDNNDEDDNNNKEDNNVSDNNNNIFKFKFLSFWT